MKDQLNLDYWYEKSVTGELQKFLKGHEKPLSVGCLLTGSFIPHLVSVVWMERNKGALGKGHRAVSWRGTHVPCVVRCPGVPWAGSQPHGTEVWGGGETTTALCLTCPSFGPLHLLDLQFLHWMSVCPLQSLHLQLRKSCQATLSPQFSWKTSSEHCSYFGAILHW